LGLLSKKKGDLKKKEEEMSFLDHIEALRWHVIRGLIAVFIIAVIVFLSKDFVFNVIIFGPLGPDFFTYRTICNISEALCFSPDNLAVKTLSIQEKFITHLKVSFWMGVIIGFPYLFYEFWKFVKPGLYDAEVKAARGIVLICSLLFITGVLFGYFIISPFAITFLSNYNIGDQVAAEVTLSSLVSTLTMFTLPAGIVFELPIVIYFLSKIGLVTPEFLRQYRKHAFVIILVVSAVITPPDVVTQLLIGFPLYLLYEISIKISARVVKKAAEKAKETENS